MRRLENCMLMNFIDVDELEAWKIVGFWWMLFVEMRRDIEDVDDWNEEE